mgnify:CR=1 FL=1
MTLVKLVSLLLVIICAPAWAAEFSLESAEKDSNGVDYYSLHASKDGRTTTLSVALEGNARQATIRELFSVTCPRGKIEGVRVDMSSPSLDGSMLVNNLYFFDRSLNVIAAKSYTQLGSKWLFPLSLKNAVCAGTAPVLHRDPATGKDYIAESEVILQGPFLLKGLKDVAIKYINDGKLKLIREDANGESVVKKYDNNNKYASVKTVLFVPINGQMSIVSLITWGEGENISYKVDGSVFDDKGNITPDSVINRDPELSGGVDFAYQNAAAIKKYLAEKYNK